MGHLDVNAILRNLPYLWEGLQLSFLLTTLAIAGGITDRLWSVEEFIEAVQ